MIRQLETTLTEASPRTSTRQPPWNGSPILRSKPALSAPSSGASVAPACRLNAASMLSTSTATRAEYRPNRASSGSSTSRSLPRAPTLYSSEIPASAKPSWQSSSPGVPVKPISHLVQHRHGHAQSPARFPGRSVIGAQAQSLHRARFVGL